MISLLLETPVTPSRHSLAVLLVDDSKVVRKRLKEMLAEACAGCKISEADGPRAAIELMEAQKFDIVIMDIRMPGGSGMDAIEEVKAVSPDSVIIMFTNYSDSYYRDRCLEMGASHFYDKSAEFDRVIEAVRELANGD